MIILITEHLQTKGKKPWKKQSYLHRYETGPPCNKGNHTGTPKDTNAILFYFE
jgi:hypothetical protein